MISGFTVDAKALLGMMEKAKIHLEQGKPAKTMVISKEDTELFQELQLLSSKPMLYVCNVSEAEAATGNEWTLKVAEYAG